MSDGKKREIEERCMKIAIKHCKELEGYRIDNSRAKAGLEEERPDFILTNGTNTIGVEHFLVDTLLREQNNCSKCDSESRFLLNLQHALAKEKDKNHNIASKHFEIEDIYQKEKEAKESFSYELFEKEFLRVFVDHMKNIEGYKKENNMEKLGFVCEINISANDYEWIVTKNGKSHIRVIEGIPITEKIWLFIYACLLTHFIDFFIFTTIPFNSVGTSKSIYLTAESNPTTYDSFSYK